ncbi:hypothetical protein APV28_4542 [Comamonas testosteroni]|nr:hypothetical protein APV28_4542 [Comamonas testosteroni]
MHDGIAFVRENMGRMIPLTLLQNLHRGFIQWHSMCFAILVIFCCNP